MKGTQISRRGLGRIFGAWSALGISFAGVRSAQAAEAPAPASRRGPPADDRFEIIELMARYAWAYDTADAAALEATFVPGGQLIVWGQVMASKKEDFVELIGRSIDMRGDHGWQHLVNHHLFRDYDGQRCTVYSYFTMPQSDAGGGNVTVRAMGYYVSKCVRTPAGWRFESRSTTRWNGKAPIDLMA